MDKVSKSEPKEKDATLNVLIVNQEGTNIVDGNTTLTIQDGPATVSNVSNTVVVEDLKKKTESSLKVLVVTGRKNIVGHFARYFEDLAPFRPPIAALMELGEINGKMFDTNLDADDNPARKTSVNTYFEQFIDHDLTLEATLAADVPLDVDMLINSRDAILNLDSVYGKGPTGNPELYNESGRFILTQNGRDLNRRSDGSAILVEARNDENLIIAQIHVAMCRYHNAWMDTGVPFSEARRQTVLAYQFLIRHHTLPSLCDASILNRALNNQIGLYKFSKGDYIPIEWSGAVNRYGHTNVRKAYVMGADQLVKTQVFNENGNDLRGGRPIPPNLIIQWSNFTEVPGTTNPQPPVNVARKFDVLLSSGLFALPPGVAPTGSNRLPQRNLQRGKAYGLPCGQEIAQVLGFTPLTNEAIGLTDPRFEGKAPLWYYILAEANIQTLGTHLGQVGSTIVAETLVSILRKDRFSVLNGNAGFAPLGNTSFGFGDFFKFAGVA